MYRSSSRFGTQAGGFLLCLLLVVSSIGSAVGAESPQGYNRYVAKYGSDTGPNSCLNQNTPCLTIGHAISQSVADDSIYIAQGKYVETLNIEIPLKLLGGYQEHTWVYNPELYETIIDGSGSRAVAGDWDGDRVSTPTVIAVPGGYKMWYDGWNQINGYSTGLATSTDGVSWNKHGSNPVLTPAGGGAWDNWFSGQVSVLLEGGVYKMWYSGAGDPWQTGYATSTDGINWTIYASNPVLPVGPPGSWDEQEADGMVVIKDGTTYKMWYHGANKDYTTSGIGYATSPDGVTWTKYASNPVLTPNAGAWDESGVSWPRVIKNGATFEMWYFSDGHVGRATSTNGVSWTKYAGNPVISNDWEGQGVRNGSILFDGSAYHFWFRSGAQHDSRIGYATSTDGISWTMHPSNPVLQHGTPTLWGESTISVSGGGGHTLDGLTITGAEACQEGAGGVSIQDTTALVSHSMLINNKAVGGCGGGGIGAMGGQANLTLEYSKVKTNTGNGGGGVMSWDGAHIFMRHTEVSDNEDDGWGGGGVFVGWTGASMVIEESLIINNRNNNGPGGGIYLDDFSSFKLFKSTVMNNLSMGSGGGVWVNRGSATIDNTKIEGNQSNDHGGGVWVESDGALLVDHSMVTGNTTQAQGGGLSHRGNLTLMDSEVLDNIAYGGAGGISVHSPDGGGSLTAVNTVIAHNQGTWGGGIAPFWRGSLVNVTVANNDCSECGNAGIEAPADSLNSPHIFRNTIVYFNTPGNFYCEGDCDVQYSDIQGGWSGKGNFDSPPMFINSTARDYRLDSGSPCIDAGTSAGAPDHDRDGDPRPINHGFDVGADEYGAPYGMGPVVMKLAPAETTQYVGQPFQVEILVEAGAQLVNGAEAHLDFDPALLQVTTVTAGTALPVVLQNSYNNTTGMVDFSAGDLYSATSGTFTLATVTFNPLATTAGNTVDFHLFLPRESNVVYGGSSVLHHTENAKYFIRNDASLQGGVTLQGRPTPPNARWITPLTVKLYQAGQPDPVYTLTPTTDNSGHFSLEGIAPGDYTIVVKNSHTLANSKSATLAFGQNTLDFGTLREGDADDNNCVAMVDFSILATTFGPVVADDRADFDENGAVNITDFSLLAASFGLCGNLPVAAPVREAPARAAPAVDVAIVVQPASQTVQVGQTFTLSVVVQSGAQLVDGAEAHLNFDASALRVDQVSGNTIAFPLPLQNTFSNSLGTVDYAAGTITNFPSGNTTLATIQFQALKPLPLSEILFMFNPPRQTDVTYGGHSILTQHQDGQLVIEPSPIKLVFLPLVRK
jgi:hypothetical protein